jgi:class 3 adenylate cyclase/tetratricopeptide (TPR) repeat protein
VADQARFCSSCGHPLGARGDERRVATVLFADLVGFTSLSETRDPEQVKNLVDSCFERLVRDINEFGGKVDKIVGDAILALFGAPVAHEDDAERAVRAALRLQSTLAGYCSETGAGVQLRIGVNTGEVLVGALRAGGDYTAMGDVVNSAQRLQSAARPGAVLVGAATYAATRSVVEYLPSGPITAKGRDEPIEAFEAVAARLPPGYRPRRVQTPFVGRDAELGILLHAVAGAVSRARSHVVLLLGEAGVGKSRLAEEVAERARSLHGALVYEGRCVPYGEANVWWPVAEALRQACGVSADAPLREASERCTEAVASVLGMEPAAAEVARVVHGMLHLMGYEGPLDDIEPQRAREEAVRAVLAFLEGSARSRPVVVVLSDLHWADDAVLGVLDMLAERLSRSRFVLVATARQGLLDRWSPPAGRHNTILVNLDPLDRGASRELLSSIAGPDLDESLGDDLLDRSGGNPFFLEELVALVAEAGGSPAGAPQVRSPELPDTLRGLVAARIDGLGPHERSTLDDAAVWGRSGPIEALERMAEQIRGTVDLSPVLTGLVDKEILVVDGKTWSFRSDLVREVAYSTLTKADRAKRHHGIAVFLDQNVPDRDDASLRAVDVIAHHYAAAAELLRDLGPVAGIPAGVDRRALEWLEEAATRAEVAQMPLVAERLYDQAVGLLEGEPTERRVDNLLGRARAEAAQRRNDTARCTLDDAAAQADQLGYDLGRARALLVRGDLEQKTGELDESIATLTAAARTFRELGDMKGRAEALRLRGMAHIFRGGNEEAEESVSDALDAYRELGDRRGEGWALQNLAWIAYVRGQTSEAEARLAESAATFGELGDGGGLSWALGLMAFVRYHQGRMAEAEELARQIIEEARDRGDKWGVGMMLLLLAGVQLWSGRALGAVGSAEEALGLFVAINDRFGQTQSSAMLGRSLATAGEVTNGMQLMLRAFESLPSGANLDEHRGLLAATLASTAVQVGDVAAAEQALHGYAGSKRIGLGTIERMVVEGLVALQRGDTDEAVRLLERAITSNEGSRSMYAESALVLARAAQGDTEAVRTLADDVIGSPRATYHDDAIARLAVELDRARAADEAVVDGFTDLIASLDGTDDVVAQAVVRLAEALALEKLGLPSSGVALESAEARLADLGIDADGWRTVFRLALGADRAAAGA